MKRYLLILSFLFFGTFVKAQTIAFRNLADLVSLNLPQLNDILLKTGKFKIKEKESRNGKEINYYQSIDQNKSFIKGEKITTGFYHLSGDGVDLHTLTYQTIYPDYVLNMMKEMEKLGYRISFKGVDTEQKIFIYDNKINHVTVAMHKDHTINTVQIRQNELDIEQ